MRRRAFLASGVVTLGALAGCSGDGATATPGENEVLAGPNNQLAFVPETITVSPGTTVTWTFETPNHNVACAPEQLDSAAKPDAADAFTTYDGTDSYATVAEGETYDHTFEVAGTYDYVCVPHITNGMTGTVVVEE